MVFSSRQRGRPLVHIPPDSRFLLRYRPERILPPGPGQLLFRPLVSFLLLAISIPHSVMWARPSPAFWYAIMLPLLLLQLKVYGQWVMSAGPTCLSRVANPSVHLSVIGNFSGTVLGMSAGLREGPLFFFSVGMAHYIVLLVTLYQRLPTTQAIPRELHPVFFFVIAAPSVASIAWAELHGSFGYASRVAYFFAMFLYSSLVGMQTAVMKMTPIVKGLSWMSYAEETATCEGSGYTTTWNHGAHVFINGVLLGLALLALIYYCRNWLWECG